MAELESDFKIIYVEESYFKSFHSTLTNVAAEGIYLEMIEPPSLEKVSFFQKKLIDNKLPGYYALSGNQVVGWIDIFPKEFAHHQHRASLGMGILKEHRGKGLGSRLIEKALEHVRTVPGIEKVELTVYTSNAPAIKLYKKFGFKNIGINHKYRKVNGQYFDALSMELFI